MLSALAALQHAPPPRYAAALSNASTSVASASDADAVTAARVSSGVVALDDSAAPLAFTNVAAAASFVIRRAVLQLASCVLEAGALLPLLAVPLLPCHGGLSNVAMAALTGGLLGVHVASFDAVAESKVGSSAAVGHVTAPPSSMLTACLTESAVPEVGLSTCHYAADASDDEIAL
jgi:hypothetical protein